MMGKSMLEPTNHFQPLIPLPHFSVTSTTNNLFAVVGQVSWSTVQYPISAKGTDYERILVSNREY